MYLFLLEARTWSNFGSSLSRILVFHLSCIFENLVHNWSVGEMESKFFFQLSSTFARDLNKICQDIIEYYLDERRVQPWSHKNGGNWQLSMPAVTIPLSAIPIVLAAEKCRYDKKISANGGKFSRLRIFKKWIDETLFTKREAGKCESLFFHSNIQFVFSQIASTSQSLATPAHTNRSTYGEFGESRTDKNWAAARVAIAAATLSPDAANAKRN